MNISFAKLGRGCASQALCGTLIVLSWAQAVAQEIQEVVVTAERREEKLQDVPIAVSAFTSQPLQSLALADIHALSNLTPSVNLDSASQFSGDRSVQAASIRDIS